MSAKPSLAQRAKADPALLRRILANPGLRSKLPASMLTPAQRRQRQTNVRLSQPIVPGSSTTERDLARNANAAMDVKYGPVEAQEKTALASEKQRTADVGGFYDQYLKQIAQHATNVQNIGQTAVTAGQNTQNAVTGLANADLTQLQNPAVASAQSRGATAGDLSQMASNAAAVRQALVGSFVARQAGTNAANSNYADTQAHVVAPGQKLVGQAIGQGRERDAQKDITTTTGQRAADSLAYRTTARSDEAKNILAQQIATGKTTAQADAAKLKKATIYGPGGSKQNHYGYTYDEWTKLPEKDKETARNPPKTPSTTGYGVGKTGMNKYGYTYDEWTKLTPKAQADARAGKGGKGDKPAGKGPEWLTPNEANTGLGQLATLKNFISKAMKGDPFIAGHTRQKPLDRAGAEAKVRAASPSLKSPALLTAAADAVQLHYLATTTVRALIDAGFKPSVVARTLGVPTSGQLKASDPKPNRPG